LQAICELIIPADEDPGATQAGVVHYIDRQLTGKFREHQKSYREGLAAAAHMAPGEVERAAETRTFFGLVVTHAMQGFYGSPRHGGNRDFASWRMLRIPLSPVRGRIPEASDEKG